MKHLILSKKMRNIASKLNIGFNYDTDKIYKGAHYRKDKYSKYFIDYFIDTNYTSKLTKEAYIDGTYFRNAIQHIGLKMLSGELSISYTVKNEVINTDNTIDATTWASAYIVLSDDKIKLTDKFIFESVIEDFKNKSFNCWSATNILVWFTYKPNKHNFERKTKMFKAQLTSLQAIAYAAHYLEKFLAKTKEEQSDKDTLANVLTIVSSLTAVLNGTRKPVKEQIQNFLSPTLTKLERVLKMFISTDMTPIDVAREKYGAEGVRLFKHLESLGYDCYSFDFWLLIVNALEPQSEAQTVSGIGVALW